MRKPHQLVLGLLVSLLLALTIPSTAKADSWGQYLVVIDDSGSMNKNDPKRLVVMASMALAAGLEDGDQVMLVGLGELASGDVTGPRFVSPRDLLPGRDGPEGSKAIANERVERLASHHGGTPCREALARARTILEEVASAGAPQTLFLLTDGACNGSALDAASTWLGGLTSHKEGRFRFVLLTRKGERADPNLESYGKATGWTGDSHVSFDARALLRAFAEVLSFSRGLKYDDGGRVGLERTFAGARNVRVLAISDDGAETIELAKIVGGKESTIGGGPTWRHEEYGWSLRVATEQPSDEPYAVRSTTPGAEVLVIPSYGQLQLQSVVAPCGAAPALPWTREVPVRAGQPACAWARLVGDTGETIVRGRSFQFDMLMCEKESCEASTAMQPGDDGTFNAQLGAAIPVGRRERWFKASGGALASAVVERRGFQSMAFGVMKVLRVGSKKPVESLDLGTLPKPTADTLSLDVHGAFPAGGRAAIKCTIEGDDALRECVSCTPQSDEIALQDPFKVQVTVEATGFCPLVSKMDGKDLPVGMSLSIEPGRGADEQMEPHVIPMKAVLRYAAVQPQAASVVGGRESTGELTVPSPISAQVTVEVDAPDLPDGLVVQFADEVRFRADPGGTSTLTATLTAEDCCSPGSYEARLVFTSQAGGPPLEVPLSITVEDPGWWTCPGKTIAFWAAIALAGIFLIWVAHGFLSPAKFSDSAALAFAESEKEAHQLAPDHPNWKPLSKFPRARRPSRGFRRPATVYVGGSNSPFRGPLTGMSEDARIVALKGGSVELVSDAGATEIFEDGQWQELEAGKSVPVVSEVLLRREGFFLKFHK